MLKESEIVIKATNLGVAFKTSKNKDDYKSHAINILKRKKEDRENGKSKYIWPIRGINFTGYKGEVLGIVGSNGSGKTTLCKLLTGILTPDEGELSINGEVTTLFSMGMGFNKDLTGRENVYLNGMMLGIEKSTIKSLIQDIKDFSGLNEFFEQPMKKYSSGMRARLGFSVAANLKPDILILDEALNTGDLEFGQRAAQRIKELVSKAKMVIIVTHSHGYARKHCDRLIWLEKGEVKKIGDPNEVLKEYESSIPKVKRKPRKKIELKSIQPDIREDTVIEATNVGIHYNLNGKEHWALKNVSFKINEGEVVGIIGHNGAGKSTLCKLLTKILAPDQGRINVKGDTTALLNYGTGFNAQLSGADNIYLNGMLLGIPKPVVESNYKKIVEFAELENSMHKSVKYYSSGMRARLGFSIAATLQPDIFIIDEALSTGDIAFRQKASEKIQDMMEDAKAVILVSHSMNFVEKICTRAIWLEKGEIKMDGKSEVVVKKYIENKTTHK